MSGAATLSLSKERIVMYGMLLALIASLPFVIFPHWFVDVAYRGDFANFWSAGANAGTASLLDPAKHAIWQRAHGITPQTFVYPPAFAWIYAPLAHLSPIPAMAIADACAIALFVVAGLLAARIYGFAAWFAVLAVFAWGPVMNAWEVGQNTSLALVLILAALFFVQRDQKMYAALSVGLLLYKPSIALPFVALLAIRKEWRMLGVVGACAVAWYLAGIVAAGGDAAWLGTYVHLVAGSNAGEFAGNAHKTYTIPTLLLAAGVPLTIAYGCAAAVFVAALPLLARAGPTEAWSMTPAIGIAASIHSWPYEAALLLPSVFFAMRYLLCGKLERIVLLAYVVAALALVAPFAGHALALIAVGGALSWIFAGYWKGERQAVRLVNAR